MEMPSSRIESSELKWFMDMGQSISVEPGVCLIQENQPVNFLYLVKAGGFRLEKEKYANKIYQLIGEGEILGELSFLQNRFPEVSVVAIEPSEVLAIPMDILKERLSKDPIFSIEFYSTLSEQLAERLRSQLNVNLGLVSQEHKNAFLQLPRGPIPLFLEDGTPDFEKIEKIIAELPSLVDFFSTLEAHVNPMEPLLQQREKALGVATLSSNTLAVLFNLLLRQGSKKLEARIHRHFPSLTAAEKKDILLNVDIQKTLTVKVANQFILITGMGDYQLKKEFLNEVADRLHLPRSAMQRISINPPSLCPEVELGLLRGMVSTFFKPHQWHHISAIMVHPGVVHHTEVSISISPCESLIFPSSHFVELIRGYAEEAYPYIPFMVCSA